MADVVSDVFLSCCCCFYSPGDRRGVGTNSNTVYHHHVAGGLAGRRTTGRNRPVSLQTVELKVRMCCEGCERLVRHALMNLRGEVDLVMEKVRVTGYAERGKVRRSGKEAWFWPSGGTPLRFTSAKGYFRDDDSYRETYNHHRHGYGDGDRHGRMREPARGVDPVSNMFNDSVVNACTIV